MKNRRGVKNYQMAMAGRKHETSRVKHIFLWGGGKERSCVFLACRLPTPPPSSPCLPPSRTPAGSRHT
jgi:hypothetical protein